MNNTIDNINSWADVIHVLVLRGKQIAGYRDMFYRALEFKHNFEPDSAMWNFWNTVTEKWEAKQSAIITASEKLINAYEEKEKRLIERFGSSLLKSVPRQGTRIQERKQSS